MKRGTFAVWCVLLALCVLIPVIGRADFGDFSGDSDYGSWDSGSSWSSSSSESSSSWDWDNDNDGWSSSGSSPVFFPFISGGSGSSSSGSGSILGFILVILIVFLVIRGFRKAFGNLPSGTASYEQKPAGAQRTPDEKLTPISEYGKLDPGFDVTAFREKLSNLYVRMQNGWTDKDIDPMQPYFTDALFKQMKRQLQSLINAHQTNYVERIAVLDTNLRGFFQENGEDHLIAEIRTRIIDYTLDDGTGKLIRGHRTKEKYMTYEWELTRATGTRTKDSDGLTRVSCPACGAPLDINTTTHCPYCGSIVTLEAHDWAISAIRGIAQHTAS